MFIGRTDVEAEAPILWPPDAKLGNIEGRRPGLESNPESSLQTEEEARHP